MDKMKSPPLDEAPDLLLCFFLAPVTAFFLPKVYRDAVRASWRKGACYIAYGALIFTTLVTAIFLERSSRSDKFFDWIKEKTPAVIWTPAGLSLESGQKTARMTHPTYGPIAAFDMDREAVTKEDMGQFILFITSKRIVFQKPFGKLEDRDVTKTTLQTSQPVPATVRVTGELIEKFYKKIRNAILIFTPVVTITAALLVLGVINGIYAFAGLLFNLVRSQKLSTGEIFNLACFSSGMSLTVMGFIMIGLAFSRPFPELMMPISLLVSLLYMIVAVIFVKKSDSKEPSKQPPVLPPAP